MTSAYVGVFSTPAAWAASENTSSSTYFSARPRRCAWVIGWLLLLKAFTRLSNCSLVMDIVHSAVLGTLVLIAMSFCAGQRPRMLITGWFGGTSAGFSSRFSREGGPRWPAGEGDGVATGAAEACFAEKLCGFWAAAVTAKRMHMIRLRVIVFRSFRSSGESSGN